MSKFYLIKENATNTITIDDTETSTDKTWSSYKTNEEIQKNKIAKFEELEDVDVSNKKDKQLVAYSETTGKFTTIGGVEAGEITGAGLKQVCKMGLIGSPEKPHIVNIPVNTIDFKVPRVNVLRYDTEGTQDQIITKNAFINGESNDFKTDDMVVFDGKAYLKTEYVQDYTVMRDEETFTEYSAILDLGKFKKIVGFEDFEEGLVKKLKIKAIPFDRLLVPVGDMNLSNAEHIDYFKLTANGENIRIVCSVDSGDTWKTFKTDKWVDVDLDIESVRANGIDVETFNKINDVFWNKLVTTHKIRFAYLFSMDSITDIEELDNLDLQFDGQGKWMQAKEDTFDIVYASNTLLQVYVKFSGDIKINY